MMRVLVLFAFVASPGWADSVIATRLIRAQTVIAATDMTLVSAEIPGALADTMMAIVQEARVTLYPGRAIRAEDLGPAAIIERNQIVALSYTAGGLGIVTDGRALARGSLGEVIRVMNLSSRNTVFGQVAADGSVQVGSRP
jgi:flagella basal body P-ring formation protein FlgA